MADHLPSNVTVSKHPCLAAKLSQLRSSATNARSTKSLVHELALLVASEALAETLETDVGETDTSALGYEFQYNVVNPRRIALIPILRSGLAMVDALQTLLPDPIPVHHLGLYREKATNSVVEYYNKLPYQLSRGTGGDDRTNIEATDLAIVVDPVIATGATCEVAVDTLRDWGVGKILILSIICSATGVKRVAERWPEGVRVWSGGMDPDVDAQGMLMPGVGDIGDRLFQTTGK